jgi:hypothetical protein
MNCESIGKMANQHYEELKKDAKRIGAPGSRIRPWDGLDPNLVI